MSGFGAAGGTTMVDVAAGVVAGASAGSGATGGSGGIFLGGAGAGGDVLMGPENLGRETEGFEGTFGAEVGAMEAGLG